MKKHLARFHLAKTVSTEAAAKAALSLLAFLDKYPFKRYDIQLADRVLISDLLAKRARAIHTLSCAKAA